MAAAGEGGAVPWAILTLPLHPTAIKAGTPRAAVDLVLDYAQDDSVCVCLCGGVERARALGGG